MFIPDPDLFTNRILDPPGKEERFEIPSRRLAKYFSKLTIIQKFWTGAEKDFGYWTKFIKLLSP
jgi:hypothetical protein